MYNLIWHCSPRFSFAGPPPANWQDQVGEKEVHSQWNCQAKPLAVPCSMNFGDPSPLVSHFAPMLVVDSIRADRVPQERMHLARRGRRAPMFTDSRLYTRSSMRDDLLKETSSITLRIRLVGRPARAWRREGDRMVRFGIELV